MKIIAHRGYWLEQSEKNTLVAFERAIKCGYGFETDYRDYCGKIVIAHDVPEGKEPTAEEIFSLYQKYGMNQPLAINVKADGLQTRLSVLLKAYNISNYFLFDMSVPDTLGYLNLSMNTASRFSEYERELPFIKESTTIWIDCFLKDWITVDDIRNYLLQDKQVCIVSQELHKRPYREVWERYVEIQDDNLMICTDHPDEADAYFNRKIQ